MDLFRIPADTFQLFVLVDNVIGNRFGALLAATHILALTMLSACAMAGCVKFETRRLLRFAVITLALGFGTVFGVRTAFNAAGHEYEMYQVFIERPLLLEAVESREIQDPPDPLPTEDLSRPVLDRIRERGVVRIGYAQDALPWVFRNDAGALVGFDVEMGHQLARELGVTAEFVRCPGGTIPDLLEAGYLDVAMTGMAITPTRMQRMKFSDPYVEETAAFVVKDHLREKFSTRKAIQKQTGLKIGVPRDPYYREKLVSYLPDAELVIVDSPRGYFRGEVEDLDGLLFGAATGSSWSLIYPAFTIAVPHPDVLGVPLAYGVARREGEMEDYLSRWIELKKKDTTIKRLTDYWIMGKSTETKSPRWCVLRDVLGWI